jgi:hypothetical protein
MARRANFFSIRSPWVEGGGIRRFAFVFVQSVDSTAGRNAAIAVPGHRNESPSDADDGQRRHGADEEQSGKVHGRESTS